MLLNQERQYIEIFAFSSLILATIFLIVTNCFVSRRFQLMQTTDDNESDPLNVLMKLKLQLKCQNRELSLEKFQYGDYYVLQNYIIGEKSKNINCYETLTYTSTSDYTYFQSLANVINSWMAPISLAIYAPGYDFNKTMTSIQFLRNCMPESTLIRDFVTFHIFFQNNHMPHYLPLDENEALNWRYSCRKPPPFVGFDPSELYKIQARLFFPINVGRNIARKAANTYFIFASDIELIPSSQLPPTFLKMIANNFSILLGNNGLRVFTLPVFEVDEKAEIPPTKTILKEMLAKRTAIQFHNKICERCHLVPNFTGWLNADDNEELSIVAAEKRHGLFHMWEPFFISNNIEPMFDERFTWEGQFDRRVLNFAMCLLGYEYHVLHPAFLTHMPGIKLFNYKRMTLHENMKNLIQYKIEPEYRKLYVNNLACEM